jgi:hypothetical protein
LQSIFAKICSSPSQQPKDKLYALHALEVECLAKGKVRIPCEFGVKGAMIQRRSAIEPVIGHMRRMASSIGAGQMPHWVMRSCSTVRRRPQPVDAPPAASVFLRIHAGPVAELGRPRMRLAIKQAAGKTNCSGPEQ